VTDEQKAPETTITATVKADKIDPGYTRKSTYFKLPDLKGGEIDLADYAGKPVLLMFFTENCPYCRHAAPFIEKMHRTYSPKGLNVIGICVEENADAAKDFARGLGLTFQFAYKGGDLSIKYKAQGVPFIYLLNRNHVIYEMWGGYSPDFDPEIIENIEKVLK
ncbi:MAG TPA: hypothetical protein DCG50_05805, partial [Elusimicrobia bacterium]|nr:hypothetical protein [Elusimicrobiota bacterium]